MHRGVRKERATEHLNCWRSEIIHFCCLLLRALAGARHCDVCVLVGTRLILTLIIWLESRAAIIKSLILVSGFEERGSARFDHVSL